MKDITGREIVDILYRRNSMEASINNRNSDGTYRAVTPTQGRNFKTIAGARRFLEKLGYAEYRIYRINSNSR